MNKLSWFSRFLIRLRHWEFWPFNVLYFPVGFYYTWLAIKKGSLFFFTSSNPSIEYGGMLGEKKSDVYDLIPNKYLPEMSFFEPSQLEEASKYAKQLSYPVIVKPNIGERGNLVEKLNNQSDLEAYVTQCTVPFIIQELITYPVELGVFYVRMPNEKKGRVTSVVMKEFLSVKGDGLHTVNELLHENQRALLQIDFTHPRLAGKLEKVPANGEIVRIESIGNHCRGTTFLDMNHTIDDQLNEAIDQLASEIKGFYFGRFDLKCQSMDTLRRLTDFKILELNGAGAEPGHIYQPGFSLWTAYKDILWHLNALAEISYQNKKRGYPYWPFSRGLKKIREIRRYNRTMKT